MVKIVIDALGNDKGPETIVLGAYKALNEYKDLFITLVGPSEVINKKLNELSADLSRIKVVDAPDEITNFDHPLNSLFEKPHSSLVKSYIEVGSKEENYAGMITAGATGAVLMGSFRFLADENRTRPCLAACLPAEKGGMTCIVDTGATIDCTGAQVHQFALLGRDFMKKLYKIENPKIGLLSNGAEKTKGNALVKDTHQLLAEDSTINFVGNIEGTNALSGDCDVLVCDGFAGNIILKNSEGMAKRVIHDIGRYYKQTGNPAYGELMKYLISIYDFNALGGAFILGPRKLVIKAHGACDENTIVATSKMLINAASGEAYL